MSNIIYDHFLVFSYLGEALTGQMFTAGLCLGDLNFVMGNENRRFGWVVDIAHPWKAILHAPGNLRIQLFYKLIKEQNHWNYAAFFEL